MADVIFIVDHGGFFHNRMRCMSVDVIVCNRGHYGLGIYYRINRVFLHYGLFDLCASLAGEVLGLPAGHKKMRSHLCEMIIGSNFAKREDREKL